MSTSSAETVVHAPFRVVSLGGVGDDLLKVAQDDAATANDAWSALRWLGFQQTNHSQQAEGVSGKYLAGTVFSVLTGAQSSSGGESQYDREWTFFRYFNEILPVVAAGVTRFSHLHPTVSLVDKPMHLEMEVASGGWLSLNASIDRWSRLPQDWDGNDGVAPPRMSIYAARRLLNIFSLANLPFPSGYVAGDGEIGFRWRTENGFASVSLLEDGTELAFCRQRDSQSPLRLEAQIGKLDLTSFIESVLKIA